MVQCISFCQVFADSWVAGQIFLLQCLKIQISNIFLLELLLMQLFMAYDNFRFIFERKSLCVNAEKQGMILTLVLDFCFVLAFLTWYGLIVC